MVVIYLLNGLIQKNWNWILLDLSIKCANKEKWKMETIQTKKESLLDHKQLEQKKPFIK